jgi:hypothetical protein
MKFCGQKAMGAIYFVPLVASRVYPGGMRSVPETEKRTMDIED